MRPAILILAVLASACGGGAGDTGVVIPSCAGVPILGSQQIESVRKQFPRFEPELYCAGANPRDTSTFLPKNYTPARFFGNVRSSSEEATPLGIKFKANGFNLNDISLALPARLDYFDIDGKPFSVQLPPLESDRLIRVAAGEIDQIFVSVKEQLAAQFPNNPEMQQVSPSTINVRFQASVFYVSSLDVWAGGVTSGDGKSIEVAIFHFSPRQKIPISWRGIPGVSKSWLEHEFKNAVFIQSGHPELAK